MNVFLLGRDKVGWSIDRDREHVKYFLSHTRVNLVENILKADVIYCVWYDLLTLKKYSIIINLLKKIKKIKIIANVTNDITIYKDKLEKLKEIVDLWIAPNTKVYNFIKHQGLKTELIPFYVDQNIFKRLNKSKKDICEILNIDYNLIKDKYLIGSFQRDSLGGDLLKPKWQKNPDLLIKILDRLPKEKIMLILAGPRRHYLIKKCKEFNIPYLFVGNKRYIERLEDDILYNNLSLDKISLLYNLIDLYIVSSKSEGGPKAVLESALTKTLIVSTDVGLAQDMLNEELLFKEKNYVKVINSIKQAMNREINANQYIEYNYKKVQDALNKEKLISKYKSIIENA